MSAPGLKITNFHYGHIQMPQSHPTEYPKWIHMLGYPDVIANNAEEEAALLARPFKSEANPGDVTVYLQGAQATATAAEIVNPPPTSVLTGPNDEREILLQIAKEKDIKVDLRWKTERIRATIERETKDL